MNRSMKVFFALSLFLNLLLVGITFGYTGKCHLAPRAHPMTVSDVTNLLASDKQKSLKPFIEKSEQETKVQRDQLVVERRKSFDLLQAAPFNKEAYLQQVKAAEAVHARIVENMAGVVVHIAEQSSDEERANISKMMIERQNRYVSGN